MSLGILFHINLDSPIAVYAQIKNMIQFAIAPGALSGGSPLPSARVLADELDVNPNTVTKAYRDLDLAGVVSTRRGVGVVVAAGAVEICREPIRREAREQIPDAVAECVACGYSLDEIQSIVGSTVESGRLPYMSSED